MVGSQRNICSAMGLHPKYESKSSASNIPIQQSAQIDSHPNQDWKYFTLKPQNILMRSGGILQNADSYGPGGYIDFYSRKKWAAGLSRVEDGVPIS